MKGKKYYAFIVPALHKKGITDNWPECEKIVKGKEARYRSFSTHEAAAEWLAQGGEYSFHPKFTPRLEKGVYFDAGTGRGKGVEVSVTDETGQNLLHKIIPKSKLNTFGKELLKKGMTNNYGELLGCKYALRIAKKLKVQKIFGDSKLVLNFWSKGIIKKKELPLATTQLAFQTTQLRKKFEVTGGSLAYISGDHNPADLGFH